jgi:hypothetical protein
MGSGCEVPASLMTERFLPEPISIGKDPTYRDQLEWDQDRIQQLKLTLVNLINDRRELRAICGN